MRYVRVEQMGNGNVYRLESFDFLALEPSGGCPGRIEGARNERQWTRETLRVGAQYQSGRMRKCSLAHMPSAFREAEEGLADQPNCESAGS